MPKRKFVFKLKIILMKIKSLKWRKLRTDDALRYILSEYIAKMDYDFVCDNCWGFYAPFYKNKRTKYIKILHTSVAFQIAHQPKRFFDELSAFDLLIYPSTQIDIWQHYHKNIRTIPNFLPRIPSKSTNHAQKVVLSVGRFSSEKGFLRLLDIWGMVQEMIANPNANRKSPTSSLRGARSEASATKQSKSSDLKRQSESRIEKQINIDSLQVRDSPKVQSLPDRLPRFGVAESRNNDRDSPSLAEGDTGGGFDSQNLTQWKLIIVGDGILKPEIESKIHALNLQDSIILKPFTKDIESEYLSASIYAMASHFEGFGMVLAEASSYSLPCIAFDIATGPSDIIEHNQSGFLIADNDLESYAKHLIMLMNDESMRERFGSGAKKLVGKRFSKEVVMEKWGEVFEMQL